MVFSSTVFLLFFLPIVIVVYYNPVFRSRGFRNVFLLLASLGFYAFGEPVFVLVMMASIVINWVAALLIEKKKHTRLALSVALIFDLGLLFVFKYLDFFLESAGLLFGRSGVGLGIELPIGISFFTFQIMSYVLDVYRGAAAQRSALNVGLYISMFPQLIAGPIVRYETVANEILNRRESIEDFSKGICRFIIGLFKKTVFANNVALTADAAFNADGGITAGFAWLGVIAYALQIYFDFSGYSDMAIGLGQMFGFHFLENFDHPYISRSITEFWRRWHISLGSWFRDYLYIPLGGNRVSAARHIFNLFIVWLLTGLWHGANWTFVVWGLMYFVLLASEKYLFKIGRERASGTKGALLSVYTIFFVLVGWVFFRCESLSKAAAYFGCMFGAGAQEHSLSSSFLRILPLIILACLASTPIFSKLFTILKKKKVGRVVYAVTLILMFALSLAVTVSGSYNPFIYFNF